jgi:MoaF C-terminal domain/MoaF N-terminal domain
VETLYTRGIRPRAPYDLGNPWADFRIASTDELAGREISLTLDDGTVVGLSFDTDTVTWRVGTEDAQSAPYDAVAQRDNVYFIQFEHPGKLATTSVVLNLNSNAGVLILNTLVPGDSKNDLRQDLWPFTVTGSDGTLPQLTDELVGRRAYAEYADGHTAEHIYVNPRRFAWQGLGHFDYSGAELDQCTTWKIDDQQYLITWVEEWQAVAAALLLDYVALRNVGILFGLDDNGYVHTLVGARLSVLSETDYPEGYTPPGTAGPALRKSAAS